MHSTWLAPVQKSFAAQLAEIWSACILHARGGRPAQLATHSTRGKQQSPWTQGWDLGVPSGQRRRACLPGKTERSQSDQVLESRGQTAKRQRRLSFGMALASMCFLHAEQNARIVWQHGLLQRNVLKQATCSVLLVPVLTRVTVAHIGLLEEAIAACRRKAIDDVGSPSTCGLDHVAIINVLHHCFPALGAGHKHREHELQKAGLQDQLVVIGRVVWQVLCLLCRLIKIVLQSRRGIPNIYVLEAKFLLGDPLYVSTLPVIHRAPGSRPICLGIGAAAALAPYTEQVGRTALWQKRTHITISNAEAMFGKPSCSAAAHDSTHSCSCTAAPTSMTSQSPHSNRGMRQELTDLHCDVVLQQRQP